MVTFITRAINDRIVSGTMKLSDNISKCIRVVYGGFCCWVVGVVDDGDDGDDDVVIVIVVVSFDSSR